VIRVLIADDNPVIVQGLRGILALSADIEVVATVSDGREAVRRAEETAPDVVILDVQMPLMDGVAAARSLAGRARVLMLTYSDSPEVVVGSIRAGAAGYLVHGRFEPNELAQAVRDVAAGRTVLSPAIATTVFAALRSQPDHPAQNAVGGLTRREREIMNLIVKGHPNRRIAQQVFVSEKTVKNHVNNIYGKLGVHTRAEAIALWLGVHGTDETDDVLT